jgi:hypothetical protein
MLLISGQYYVETFSILNFSITYSYFYLIGYTYEFGALAIACRDRLKTINQKLLSKRFLTRYDVTDIIEFNRKILKIIAKIDKYVTPFLIPVFFCLLFIGTFMAYTEVRLILKTANHKNFLIMNNFFWVIIYFYMMAVMCFAAEALKAEAKKFKEICYEFLVSNKFSDIEARKALKTFINSIDDSRMQLRTIFFNIDWNLFFQVIFYFIFRFFKKIKFLNFFN